VFQAAGDDLALYVAYAALSELDITRAQMDAALEAFERAYAHAQHAGYVPPGSFGQRAFCRFAGTTPVPELLAWLDENEAREGRDYFFRAYRAGGLAMLGRFDEARAILAEARAELAERGGGILLANITAFESVWVSSGPAIPSPQPSSERKGSGCTRGWGIQVSVDCGRHPGAGDLRTRPARRGRRMGPPRRRARLERRRR
jgi:hypothetical protein